MTEAVVLDFAFSERDKRLGCVMRDYSLCFWEFSAGQFRKELAIKY